jgi:hypothetical protein
MPMNTTRRTLRARRACTTCAKSSSSVRLRSRPSRPVQQKRQPTAQPTWVETHTPSRGRMHALDRLAIAQRIELPHEPSAAGCRESGRRSPSSLALECGQGREHGRREGTMARAAHGLERLAREPVARRASRTCGALAPSCSRRVASSVCVLMGATRIAALGWPRPRAPAPGRRGPREARSSVASTISTANPCSPRCTSAQRVLIEVE